MVLGMCFLPLLIGVVVMMIPTMLLLIIEGVVDMETALFSLQALS